MSEVILPDGTKIHYDEDGRYHCNNGPSIEYTDGTKFWCKHGKHHREDGPAIECSNGEYYYYVDGKPLTKNEFRKLKG